MATAFGAMTFWNPPEPRDAVGPVLVALAGSRMSDDDLARAVEGVSQEVHVVRAALPVRGRDRALGPELRQVAEAVDAAIFEAFGRRPVTVLGFDDAGVVAAALNGPSVLRAVVVEPLIEAAAVRGSPERLEKARATGDAGLIGYLDAAYGAPGGAPPSHRASFGGSLDVDVVVGGRYAESQVDAAARNWLASQRGVRVRAVPGAGHDILAEGAAGLRAVVAEALAWVAQLPGLPASRTAIRLAQAVPLDAACVLYQGPEPQAFAAAYLALNPGAQVTTDADRAAEADVVALHDPAAALPDVSRLRPDVRVVAVTSLGAAARTLELALAKAGLAPVATDRFITPRASALLRAQRGPAPAVAPVVFVPLATRLMDIRTRLPVAGLRTDFGISIDYIAPPFGLSARPDRRPYILIMQRLKGMEPKRIHGIVAHAIAARAVMVQEYDDHPGIVSDMILNQGMTEDDWERFRVAHAIQTSTEPLGALFAEQNPEVRVFQNAVFDLRPFPSVDRGLRVVFGGVTRGPFVVEVAKALAPAIEAYPDTEFVVLGDRQFFDALPTARKVFHEYLPFERYLDEIASCSISLSPLFPRPGLETKSDAKYLDAARAGVMTIASPTVYERTIRHGENGMIARTMDDWPRMLADALGNPAARMRMARAAWEEVRDTRMFAHQVADRRDWYASLLKRREELNEAILRRSPGVAAALAELRGTAVR